MFQNLRGAVLFLGIHGDQQLLHLLVMERRCSSGGHALVFSRHHPEPANERLHGAGLGLCHYLVRSGANNVGTGPHQIMDNFKVPVQSYHEKRGFSSLSLVV